VNTTIDSREAEALASLTRSLEERDVGRAKMAFVLGSGLGSFAEGLSNAHSIPYAEIDSMPCSQVPGHAGELVVGEIAGAPLVVQKGRVHLYEGHGERVVTRCVRAFAALGIEHLVLTNAAGGLEADWEVPALMRITDHLNFQGCAPLAGGQEALASPYDVELGAAVDSAALDCEVELHRGVYAAVFGPNYETPAEIRMLRWAGAQAVGMSTIAEASVASTLGMRVTAISTITNQAAGISPTALEHEEVVDAGRIVAPRFCRLLEAIVPRVLAL